MILVLGIGGNLVVGYQISVISYPSVVRETLLVGWEAETPVPDSTHQG